MEQVLMHAPEAEQSVIGGILIDNDSIEHLASLAPAHFFSERNRRIYAAALNLIGAGKAADVITVFDATGADPDVLSYLNQIAKNTPSARNIGHYAKILIDRAQRRGIMALATDLSAMAIESVGSPSRELVEHAQREIDLIAADRVSNEPGLAADDLYDFITDLEEQADGRAEKAMSTGFPDLDRRMAGGMRRGELIVVAARPKMGKTAFALNVSTFVAREKNVLVLSMEMPKKQLHQRNVASLGEVDMDYLLQADTIPTEGEQHNKIWDAITKGLERLRKLKLWVDDQGGMTLLDVRTKARSVKRKHGLDLIVIDYLQLMTGEGDNRNAQIETITRGLKSLAKELGVVIILLSQLNRQLESRPDKRPMPSDLRDSGAIEQDCDSALFLYREEVYSPDTKWNGIAEVNVALIRQGSPGRVCLNYTGSQTLFTSLPRGWVAPNPPEEGVKKRSKGFD